MIVENTIIVHCTCHHKYYQHYSNIIAIKYMYIKYIYIGTSKNNNKIKLKRKLNHSKYIGVTFSNQGIVCNKSLYKW